MVETRIVKRFKIGSSPICMQRNVSRALAEMINDGIADRSEALELAQLMFYDNPQNLYRLNADELTLVVGQEVQKSRGVSSRSLR